ncbi:hypothetical protein C1280_27550 [Gemmata obscuriglobus]|uniref:Uncharacterized protein n=1 Tax=Gemmata obscuriglobus TaxID=114 RepID=A0A2Z3HA17_9BACT|nr:hypothetical protein C1280_27550 [Gemmata obscuriglobus]
MGVWRGSSPRVAVGRGRRRVGTRWCGSVVLRVWPAGGWRGSSPPGAVGAGLRWAGTRRVGRWCSARPRRWAGFRGCAARGVSPGTAEACEPNPALHLTPPADL